MLLPLRSLGLAIAAALAMGSTALAQAAPAVAAASDLTFALDSIAARFRAETGSDVRLAYGSSGNFAQQLLQDAPFELFLSADEAFVSMLAGAGKTIDDGTLYAEGRIVLFAPHGSALAPDAGFAGLRAALDGGRITRFAIANPEHAPYGRAAQQALASQGLWPAIEPKLVLGENVSQAAQFAASGSAEGGIIAYSLALAPQLAELGSFALIPKEWHRPLRQRMVLMRGAGETARDFYRYLQAEPARAVFRQFGFILPNEED